MKLKFVYRSSSNFLGVFLILIFLINLVSRGVYEQYFGKQMAYLLQIFGFLLYFLSIAYHKHISVSKSTTVYLISFCVIAILSCLATLLLANFLGILYTMVMIFLSYIMLIGSQVKIRIFKSSNLYTALIIVCILLSAVGLLQQFVRIMMLPGVSYFGDQIRPSSLTGSYLHYPIILAFFVFILLEFRRPLGYVIALLTTACIVVSYSRSGVLILLISAFVLLFNFKLITWKNIFLIIVLLMAGIIFVLPHFGELETYIMRIQSIISFNDSGNSIRLSRWIDAVNTIRSSPLVFGNQTGMVTNLTKNFNLGESEIVESSFLQQALNFGIVAAVLFYWFMFKITLRLKKSLFLQALSIAFILQSFIYQSIEVFPVMIIFSMLPVILESIIDARRSA